MEDLSSIPLPSSYIGPTETSEVVGAGQNEVPPGFNQFYPPWQMYHDAVVGYPLVPFPCVDPTFATYGFLPPTNYQITAPLSDNNPVNRLETETAAVPLPVPVVTSEVTMHKRAATEVNPLKMAAVPPQPAHYCSAPSQPQPKLPKYEAIYLHELPLTLPAPPLAGAPQPQYPAQKEVIGPKRRRDGNEVSENEAIRNWQRQFDQRPRPSQKSEDVAPTFDSRGDTATLKPSNIPFASPYIQKEDVAETREEKAAMAYDPSKPPPPLTDSDQLQKNN